MGVPRPGWQTRGVPNDPSPVARSGARDLLTPRVVGGTLLALLAIAVASRLGLWQLDSWRAERAAEARDLTHVDPVPLAEVMGPDDPFPGADVGRPVTLSGTWLPEASFWVEGRELDGREGYWAMTPLSVGGEGRPAILVARGWTADTSSDPDGAPPTGDAELTGWLQPTEGTMAFDEDPSDDVYPEVRVADAVQLVDVDLYTGYVVLDEAQLESLPEVGRSTALQNLLYAVQWWIFAAFAGWIWWRWLAEERALARAGGEAGHPDDAAPTPADRSG